MKKCGENAYTAVVALLSKSNTAITATQRKNDIFYTCSSLQWLRALS